MSDLAAKLIEILEREGPRLVALDQKWLRDASAHIRAAETEIERLTTKLAATQAAFEESGAACADLESKLGRSEAELEDARQCANMWKADHDSLEEELDQIASHMEGPQQGDSSRKSSDNQGPGDSQPPSAHDSQETK